MNNASDVAGPEGVEGGELVGGEPPAVAGQPPVLGLAAMLRAARHGADLSQRELALRAGVSHGLIGALESATLDAPRLTTLIRILTAAGCRLVAVDAKGQPLRLRPFDEARDRGSRRYPSHLEVREVKRLSDWWGTWALPDRPLPQYTADWRRLRNRTRTRRPKAVRDAAARQAAARHRARAIGDTADAADVADVAGPAQE